MDIPYDDELQLPPRIQNALEEQGIFTWGDLFYFSLAELRAKTRRPRERGAADWREVNRFSAETPTVSSGRATTGN